MPKPQERRVINLDKARAARREAQSEPVTVMFDGEEFELPIELPFEVVEALVPMFEAQENGAQDGAASAVAVLRVIRALLGDSYDAFKIHRPSQPDMNGFIELALKEYGAGNGPESSGSGSPLETTSSP